MRMRSEVTFHGGRSNQTYTFWGNPELLEEIIQIFCRVKGLKTRFSPPGS
ncbi:MAG: hypothetical protein ACTSXC_04755 [Candidatus Freyarchaeota archaeon]